MADDGTKAHRYAGVGLSGDENIEEKNSEKIIKKNILELSRINFCVCYRANNLDEEKVKGRSQKGEREKRQ